MADSFKIHQINVRKSHIVTGELAKIVETDKSEFVLLQEPPTRKGTLSGMMSGTRFVCAENPREPPHAAVAAVGSRKDVLGMTQWTKQNCAVLRSSDLDITLISVYCPIRSPMLETIEYLESLINVYHRRVIIGLDTNAWHTSWGSKKCNPRGHALMEFINRRGLTILNDPAVDITFQNHVGSSAIDITLVTPDLLPNIISWNLDFTTTP